MSVFVRGSGAVTAAGMGLKALETALANPHFSPLRQLPCPQAPPLPIAVCADFDTSGILPPLVARRLDRPARMLAVASQEAMGSFGDWTVLPREKVGVMVTTWNAGTEASVELLKAVFLSGPEEASPMLFPSTVANAPASQLGILHKLAGPNLTIFEKPGGGLRALTEAASFLQRGKALAILAGGVDEAQWVTGEAVHRLRALATPGHPGLALGEGAAVLFLSSQPGPAPGVMVAGWGAASLPSPPHQFPPSGQALVVACRKALSAASLHPREVELVVSLGSAHPALARLEAQALAEVFGSFRPPVLGEVGRRLGEGAFTAVLRAVVAAEVILGRVMSAWGPGPELAALGFPPCRCLPRNALITAQAPGGAAAAVVLQRWELR